MPPPQADPRSDAPRLNDPPAPPSGEAIDKSNSRVREMFRQIAPQYDRMNHLLSMNIDRLWRRFTVRRLRIHGTAPILDVCTGTGDLAIAIKRRVGDSIPVIGSDFCFDMLAIGQHKSASRDRSDVLYLEADTQQLPFADNLFQCVTVAFGLRNVADTDRGIAEMVRVCCPGGQVAILEFSSPTAPGLKQAYSFYFRHILPRIGQWLARNDKQAYAYLPESVGQFPCGQALCDRLAAAGLKNTRFRPLTFGIASLYEGTK
ncbi:MAG: bifunctional demethylmenaquinone methyltransferase/2-methoxy-6-polyprenyl-1,4-benzoquinol methylase UbiE [Pirellulaceae bacterium]